MAAVLTDATLHWVKRFKAGTKSATEPMVHRSAEIDLGATNCRTKEKCIALSFSAVLTAQT
ncbi:MAG: hypothetical protein WCL27_14265 [Betaproteobacteria bacterium]